MNSVARKKERASAAGVLQNQFNTQQKSSGIYRLNKKSDNPKESVAFQLVILYYLFAFSIFRASIN